jgi:CRISPR-associated protein Cmr4
MHTYILQAVTPLHVGEGAAIGSINLPLTRERHTGWPVIPGSSLKGALRHRAAWKRGQEDPALIAAFGPPPEVDDLAAGSMRFGQAQLLALPVRSLKGTYVLLSCAMVLGRLARAFSGNQQRPPALPEVIPGVIAAAPGLDISLESQGLTDDPRVRGVVVLEELALSLQEDPRVADWAEWLKQWTGDRVPLERLAIVHEDLFTHAARFWTPARTRASIDCASGVVEKGKLFSVESLPSETLLWGSLDPGGDEDSLLPSEDELWHLGGQRSVGCGRVVWYRREA